MFDRFVVGFVFVFAGFVGAAYAADPDQCNLEMRNCYDCSRKIYPINRAAVAVEPTGDCVPCMKFCAYGMFAKNEDNEAVTMFQDEALAAIEERLFLKAGARDIEEVAFINPKAASVLYSLVILSAKPTVPVSSTGEVTVKINHDLQSIRQILWNDPEVLGKNQRPLLAKANDPIGTVSYRIKKNGAEAHIDMKFEPESPYVDRVMDVRVFLKWVPVEGGGYWEYAHAKGFEEVLR
jgi:hypothetical protein